MMAPAAAASAQTFDVGAEIYPWCKEYQTVSATEMEVRHAFLNDPDSMPCVVAGQSWLS